MPSTTHTSCSTPTQLKMVKKTISTARMGVMLRDLKSIFEECLPEAELDPNRITKEDLKNMDDFQRTKAKLTTTLHTLHGDIQVLVELRRRRGGVRDAELISRKSENARSLNKAKSLYEKLRLAYDKDLKKKKLSAEELDVRATLVQKFGEELDRYERLNASVGSQAAADDPTSRAISRNRQRAERRRARRARREGGGTAGSAGSAGGGAGDVEMSSRPRTQEEEQFMAQVAQNDEEIDALLDQVSAGLDELKEVALDINQNLDVQNAMLEELDVDVDKAMDTFKLQNKKIKELLVATGGSSKWCPVLFSAVILVAIIGYILNTL